MAAVDEKYGQPLPHDPNFKGPLHRRSCTDILCLLIFIIFLVVWGFAGYYAYSHGNLDRLLVPIDSSGQRCGSDSIVRNKPYLLFFDLSKCADPLVPLNGCPTSQVCVEQCPTEDFYYDKSLCTSATFEPMKEKLICKGDKNHITTCQELDDSIETEYCARWYMKSESLLKRCMSDLPSTICPYIPKSRRFRDTSTELLPSASRQRAAVKESESKCKEQRELTRQIVMEKMAKTDSFIGRIIGNVFSHISNDNRTSQVGQMVVEDIVETWPLILIGLVGSMVVCLIFIAILRWLAGPTIWTAILGVVAILVYGIYYSATRYIELKNNPKDDIHVSPNLKALIDSYLTKKATWLYILIAVSAFTVVILLIILVLRKRIVIAIALVKEGSKAVSSIISTLFFPILPWILQIAIAGYAILVLLHLMSVGQEVYQVSGLNTSSTCQCSGAAALYITGDLCEPEVFNQNCHINTATSRRQIWDSSCVDASCRYHHLDSPKIVSYLHAINFVGFFWVVCFITAFSEMVLAATYATWYWTFKKSDVPFFTLTKGFLRTMRYHLGTLAFGALIVAICQMIRVILEYVDRKLKKFDNDVTRAILCMFKCFFWCLEKFLRFINRNAYIMCAIHGKNFCGSAKDAFNLLMRNFLRVIALDQVTDFLFFLCKVLISLGMGACAYFYFGSDFYGKNLHSELPPAILVVIGAYLISSVFFSVYSMAVDTLFLCFLEDCERNDGTPERPYFMSKQLMKILGKKNKFDVSNRSG